MIVSRYNTNIRQFDIYLNDKIGGKAGSMTIYGYKNGQQECITLEGYFIPDNVR